jgi:hypothetical protein
MQMPIDNFPFLRAGITDPTSRPWLFVQITNPDTGQSITTVGLVDTGADECSLPALYAELLGHNLTAGVPKTINTGNGQTTAFGHTCTIDIFDTSLIFSGRQKIVHTIPKTPIDFMPNLHCVLLGVKTFLSSFILTVDYPKLIFSIRKP